MMRMSNIKMTTRVDRKKLLATLEENLAKHRTIVAEAKEGYRKKATEALLARMDEVRHSETTGKVVSLYFSLDWPEDHSEVYLNTIEMLRWGTEDTVELAADEFRQLVRDEWDWSNDFLAKSAGYSSTAARMSQK